MTRALVTGATGQDGSYLVESLLADGVEVVALVRPDEVGSELTDRLGSIAQVVADLADASSVRRAILDVAADQVFHLAGISSVGLSWREPVLTGAVTGLGAIAVMEASLEAREDCAVVLASSAEVFAGAAERPIRETTTIAPTNPYGAAKAYAHMVARLLRQQGGHVSSAVLFNHESPRRGPEFVTRKVSMGAARIARGLQNSISMGNLEARRDWGYAPDYVRAMRLMAEHPTPGEYVVATGLPQSVADLIRIAFDEAGVANWSDHVVQDPQFLRPTDTAELVGDASQAKDILGWEPTLSFEDMVRLMVREDLRLLDQG